MSIEVPPGVRLAIAAFVTVVGLVGATRYARTVPSVAARKPIPTMPPPSAQLLRDVVLPRRDPPPAAPEVVQPQPETRESSSDLPEPSAAPLEDVIDDDFTLRQRQPEVGTASAPRCPTIRFI
jgi:hypothetical protein